MVPGGITGYSHQAVPHYPGVSSSACLHCALIILLLFLFHHLIAYLSGTRGLWVSGVISGVVLGALFPTQTLQCQAGLQHGLPAPPDLSSLSRPHSTGLVIVSDLFFS